MLHVSKRRRAGQAALTPEKAADYRRQIRNLAGTFKLDDPDLQSKEDAMREAYKMLLLDAGLGRAVCASYSDQELLDVLRDSAECLGRAPTQNEVFFLYRCYLKARFGNWPSALRAAGMRQMPAPDLEMPDWEELLKEEPEICAALEETERIRSKLGYPPRRREVPESKRLRERFHTWENVVAAADDFFHWQSGRSGRLPEEKEKKNR